MTRAWDEIKKQVYDLLDSSDTIIIGRKLAVDYIPYWQNTLTNPDSQMYELSKKIVSAKKVVFTKTLEKSVWDNTELAKGDLTEEIRKLKMQSGKDIIVYGGSSFVSALIKEGLIDEFYFSVNPVALGKGDSAFNLLENIQQLKFKKTITYNCGIILLSYELKKQLQK